jgi:hypothetical protein
MAYLSGENGDNGINLTGENNVYFSLISDNTNGDYFLTFSKTSTTQNALYIDNLTTPLTYNPFLSTLTCSSFTGTSSNSITSQGININSTQINSPCYILFSPTTNSTGNTVYVDNIDSNSVLGYNPQNGTLNVQNISNNGGTYTNVIGKCSTCIGVNLTTDNTNGSYFIPFSKTSTSQDNILYVDNNNATTPLLYNPSNGTLTCYNFLPLFTQNDSSYRIGLNAMQYQSINAGLNIAIGTNALRGNPTQGNFNDTVRTIAIGRNAGQSLYNSAGTLANSNDDNVLIGDLCAQTMFVASRENVIIGSAAGKTQNILQSCVIIGANTCSNGTDQLLNCTIIGANTAQNISDKSNVTIVGASNLPLFSGNSAVCFGYGNGINAINNNRGIWLGSSSGQNVNSNAGSMFIGTECGNSLTTGVYNAFFGTFCDTTSGSLTNSFLFGMNASYGIDNSFYIGGTLDNIVYQDLVIAKKNRVLCNRTISTTNQTINQEDPEHIIIANNSVININLFTPQSYNIGLRFTIVKAYSPFISISITASAGLTILSSTTNSNIYNFPVNQGSISLICINTTGAAWVISQENTIPSNMVTLNTDQTITGIKYFSTQIVANQISSPNLGDTLILSADVIIDNGNLNVSSGNYNVVGATPITLGNAGTLISIDAPAKITTNGIRGLDYSFDVTGSINFNNPKYWGTIIRFNISSTVPATHTWLSPLVSAGAEVSINNNSSHTQTLSIGIPGSNFIGAYGSSVGTIQIPFQTWCKMYSNGSSWVVYEWTSLPQVYIRTNNIVLSIPNVTNTLVQFNTLNTTGLAANGPSSWLDSAITYNDSPGTFRFRNPSGLGFYVHVDISLLFGINGTGTRLLWIQHSNSTRYVQFLGMKSFPNTGSSLQVFASTEAEFFLNNGESFQVWCYQNSGLSLNIQTNPFIQIRRIG